MLSRGMMTLFALYLFMLKGIADAILDSRQSVAHLGGSENSDELIEIDESGAPVEAGEEASAKPKVD